MENDKGGKYEAAPRVKDADFASDSTSRARNRTVMLTPEMTGQMRARLTQDLDPNNQGQIGDNGNDGGFTPARAALPMPGSQGADPYASNYPSSHSSSGFEMPAPAPRATAPVRSSHGGIQWSKESPLVGFLVSYDRNPNGEAYDLRQGRIMITSSSGEQNCLVIPDETVSAMHAVMRISPEGEIQVLDQLSEHGTSLMRADSEEIEQLSGEKAVVQHGDLLKFGNRSFEVCVIKRHGGTTEE